MAWLLHSILRLFLSEVLAHLENTLQLLITLQNIPADQLKDKSIISLDLVSCYTNVDCQETISVINQLLRNKYRTKIWGITIDSLLDILTFILQNKAPSTNSPWPCDGF